MESRNVTYLSKDFPVFWEAAQGARVQDADGRRYLDLSSAFAVSSLGHGAPAVRQAILRQINKMWHGMGDVHPNAIKVELLERLAALAPGRLAVSILSSSGAEAVESALKTARLATGKRGVIAFDGGYHGLSYGTLGATDRMEFRAPFADQVAPWITHAAYPDSLRGPTEERCLDILERMLKSSHPAGPFGALLVEPVQGRGGIRVPKPSFLKGLRSIAAKHGMLLIADEIMTGFGRTGKMFGVEHAGVVPDVMCLGKAMANGFPVSACIGTPEAMRAWPPSDGEAIHTSTFLGNPLGCAMALASLDQIEKSRLAKRAALLGAWWTSRLRDRLADHPRVGEIRGAGLMIGIELVQDRRALTPDAAGTARVVTECLRRGLIVLSGGKSRNVLTLTPPLTITKPELERATQILKEVMNGTARNSH